MPKNRGCQKRQRQHHGDDTREGLTAIVYIKMPSQHLQFEGQTKGKLGNAEVQPIVQSAVKEGLDTYFEENPADGRAILEKSFSSTKRGLLPKPPKTPLSEKGHWKAHRCRGKLADCQEKDPSVSELFIVEGTAPADQQNKEGIESFKRFCLYGAKF